MSRPIPRRFRGAPEPTGFKTKNPRFKFNFTFPFSLKIPAYIALGVIAVVALIYFTGGRTEASPAMEEIGIQEFELRCRLRGEIRQHESLYIALTNAGMTPRLVHNINRALDGVFDPRKILPGDKYTVDIDENGGLVEFELMRSPWEHYRIKLDGDSLVGFQDSKPLTFVIRAAKGEVKSTLWESMVKEGVPAEAILRFTDILSFNVDFLTETRDGQRFALLYEQNFFDGKPIGVGRVIAAEYWISDTSYGGIYYMDPDSTAGYYTLDGRNTKKALLRTPLTYRRISSHFTRSRYHPILKIYRPHLGVDYAAPEGTPVSASGSGVITYAGWKGGYGNFIEIRHENNIITQYGHLRNFARGIRKGVRVSQGQLIGYVGTTGLSTGPHLDYRVKVKGEFVNPLKFAFPDGPPVKSQYMSDFRGKAVEYLALLRALTDEDLLVDSE
ncbi:MAG TPA: M23 family metallopeptidase [candidate division Zixibacteria bacterium]|nr:M23 family metallopeptidase [candidate division Zixibacteria bacterium]